MSCITQRDNSVVMTYDITSVEGLIAALGGNTVIGEWLGITPEAVANWKARNHIPPGWHIKLAAAIRRKGKTIDPAVFGLDPDDVPFLNQAVA